VGFQVLARAADKWVERLPHIKISPGHELHVSDSLILSCRPRGRGCSGTCCPATSTARPRRRLHLPPGALPPSRRGHQRTPGGGAAAARAPRREGQVRRAVTAAGLRGPAGGGRGALERATHAGGRGAELQRRAHGGGHGRGGGARRGGRVLGRVRRVRRQERGAVRRDHPGAAGQDGDGEDQGPVHRA
jgi:hypothetical protein